MNEADIPQLYAETRLRLVRLAEAHGAGNRAEDVVQTVFLQLIEVHEEVETPLGWLIYQTRYATWTLWRREKRYVPLPDDLPEDEDGPHRETPCPRPAPDQTAQNHEVVRMVRGHLHGLTMEQRELLEGFAEGRGDRKANRKLARLITSSGHALRIART